MTFPPGDTTVSVPDGRFSGAVVLLPGVVVLEPLEEVEVLPGVVVTVEDEDDELAVSSVVLDEVLEPGRLVESLPGVDDWLVVGEKSGAEEVSLIPAEAAATTHHAATVTKAVASAQPRM